MTNGLRRLPRHEWWVTFARCERGSTNVFCLFLFVVCIALGGLAVDYANAMRIRTHLQVAADSAAHAALVRRQTTSESEAVAAGLAVAHRTMSTAVNGRYIEAADFTFGTWNDEIRSFTPSSGATEAVMVDTARIVQRANALPTLMLRIIGIKEWDVARRAVYMRYVPSCTTEGFVSETVVDVTSNNAFGAGFCVHSNGYTEVQNNNTFAPGATVSMPRLDDLVIPSSGIANNTGLTEALRARYYDIAVSDRIATMHADVPHPGSSLYPGEYLTTNIEVVLPQKDPVGDGWQEGRIHRVTCLNENNKVQVKAGTVLRKGVLITNCKLDLGQGAALEDVIVLSTNTTASAISGASGVRLGADDNCASGGGAQVITMGGVNFPADLSILGSRIMAEGSVNFAAQADSVQGASVLSNGPITGTANGLAAICGAEGMPQSDGRVYFRIAA